MDIEEIRKTMKPTAHLFITGKHSGYENLMQWWEGPHGGEWRDVEENTSTRIPNPPEGSRGHWEEKEPVKAPEKLGQLDTHLHLLVAQFIQAPNQSERGRLEREALRHMKSKPGVHDDAYRDWCRLLKWFSK